MVEMELEPTSTTLTHRAVRGWLEPLLHPTELREGFQVSVHACPRLLMRELKHVFPTQFQRSKNDADVLAVLTCQKSLMDLSEFGVDADKEKDRLLETFMAFAQQVANALIAKKYWADFIDPRFDSFAMLSRFGFGQEAIAASGSDAEIAAFLEKEAEEANAKKKKDNKQKKQTDEDPKLDHNGYIAQRLRLNNQNPNGKDGAEGVVRTLLHEETTIDDPDKNGMTPLMLACGEDHAGVAKLLLRKKAFIDETDSWYAYNPLMPKNDGWSALHYAAEVLVQYDINLKARTESTNETALEMAERLRSHLVAILLYEVTYRTH
ncbi:hypothetical protein AM588_10006426 [Phytophthora nicotianae]|uniref:Uncharacterized protein n=1 Tax=Phytophthora nicotianae TaxID=4792 RepID=A0A0W8DHN3_PHYNI|nr:hypothetical protein AM588_10006426 [Phytophthora nicotianae]